MQKNKQTNKQNIKKQKTKNEKQKNPRARGRASESFV